MGGCFSDIKGAKEAMGGVNQCVYPLFNNLLNVLITKSFLILNWTLITIYEQMS